MSAAERPTKFSTPLQRILGAFQPEAERSDESTAKIHVSDTVSRLAFVYEKIRNVIDYKDDHLLRKNAIHRILKRRLLTGTAVEGVARPLVVELIQARYLPNDQVPESKVTAVQQIIDRYRALNHALDPSRPWADRDEQYRWLIGLCAVEIEQALASNRRDVAMAEAMYEVLTQDLVLSDTQRVSREERDLQIYLAVQRALLKADEIMVAYALFRLYVPDWPAHDEAKLQSLAARFDQVRDELEEQQHHPLGEFLLRYAKRYTPYFWIIRDVCEEKPNAAIHTFASPELLSEAVRRAAGRRYAQARARLGRSVVRSFIFIFLTKMMLALLIEAPFEQFVKGAIDRRTLGINIAFHPILMLLIATTIRVPSKRNTERLLRGTHEIAYKDSGRQLLRRARLPRQRGALMRTVVALLYAATFVVTFGLIIIALMRLKFNVISGALFLFFLSIISFFAVRIRLSAREFVVLDQREGPFGFLIDFLTLPIVRVGRWISLRAPKVNLLLFIFDFLIEAPFKSFLEILEELTSFLREKKEEITS